MYAHIYIYLYIYIYIHIYMYIYICHLNHKSCNTHSYLGIRSTSAAHCNTLQQTVTYCNALRHTATHCNTQNKHVNRDPTRLLMHLTLVTWLNDLSLLIHMSHQWVIESRHTSDTLCNSLPHTAIHCNALQHIATHCNTLQIQWLIVTHAYVTSMSHWVTSHEWNSLQLTAAHCRTLQHTATHCSTLQHTGTHCNLSRDVL